MSFASPLTLARIDESALILLTTLISGCVLIYMIYSLRRWRETREREQTKREIAAYVAEGSISPNDAVRLFAAGSDEAANMIADGVAWGMIKPEKAERLIRTIRQSGDPVTPAQPSPAAG